MPTLNDIHDDFLLRYSVDGEKREFAMSVEFRDSEPFKRREIKFQNLLCYSLQTHTIPTILFGIEEADPKAFLEENKALLDSGRNYGWPGDWYEGPHPAEWLKKEGYSVYSIHCSTGLNGWIIAKKVTVS